MKKNKTKSKKLNYIKIESFFIKKIKKTINYELNLFKNVKIYSKLIIYFIFKIN